MGSKKKKVERCYICARNIKEALGGYCRLEYVKMTDVKMTVPVCMEHPGVKEELDRQCKK